MGLSIAGALIASAIFLPNLLFAILPPKNVPAGSKDAGILFTVLERIGQAGCLVILVILPVFAFGFAALSGKSVYLGIAVVFLAIGHFANSRHTYKLTK